MNKILKHGIDVSAHQGIIDWKKVKDDGIEFAMLRVGYSDVLDKYFHENVKGCNDNNIPFGVYLFSYATTINEACTEADFLLKEISLYDIKYPIAFDFEYDSLNYFERMNIRPSKDLINAIAYSFCNRIEQAGYYVMNYSNKDFYYNWFNDTIKNKYDKWLAIWNVDKPFTDCGIWQYSSTGKVNGINGNVDMNYCYKDYPTIIQNMKQTTEDNVNWKEEYYKLLNDIKALADLYV